MLVLAGFPSYFARGGGFVAVTGAIFTGWMFGIAGQIGAERFYVYMMETRSIPAWMQFGVWCILLGPIVGRYAAKLTAQLPLPPASQKDEFPPAEQS